MLRNASVSDADATTVERQVGQLPRWLIGIAVALGLGYAGFVVLLWRLGLLEVAAGDSNSQLFAAVFALLGALFGAVLTFAAALLKHSVDTRTLALNQQTEKRLSLEYAQSEARLTLETAIRAVELLSTPDGSPSSATKQAGSLFTLANLGQLDLALALLGQTWPSDGVSNDAAMWIIDRGLRDSDPGIQTDAARIYDTNAVKLASPDGPDVPELIWRGWPIDLWPDARQLMLHALITAIGMLRRDEYSDSTIGGFIDLFNGIRSAETDEVLLPAVRWTLRVLTNALDWESMGAAGQAQDIDLNAIRAELDDLEEHSEGDYFSETVSQLRSNWE